MSLEEAQDILDWRNLLGEVIVCDDMLGAVRTVGRVGRSQGSLEAGFQHHGVVPSRGEQRDVGISLGNNHSPGQACVRKLS